MSVQSNIITKEYLDICYSEIFAQLQTSNMISDAVISALQALCETNVNNKDFDKNNVIREYVAQKLFDESCKYFPDKESVDYLMFSQKIDAFFFCYRLFLDLREEDFENRGLYLKICQAKERAKEKRDFSYIPEIIISFTSFPSRIDTVYQTLASVYNQTVKPDRVILWLATSQFPNKDADLPQSLLDYKKIGFEIRWCSEDLKPHKKYYYAMKEFRNAIIVTIDDDIIYDRYMLETLLASYLKYPYAVSAMRTHLILKDSDGNILPYRKWKHEFSGVIGIPSMQLFATGCAGILYPPGCVDIDSFTVQDIKELILNADDIWLKILQVQKGTPVVLAHENQPLMFVPGSQEVALYKTNSHGNENDTQLNNVLSRYDRNGDITKAVFADNYTECTALTPIKVTENNDFSLLNDMVTEHWRTLYYNVCEQAEKLSAKATQADNLSHQLSDIRNSVSFKVGRAITWLPRNVKNLFRGK